MKRTFLAIITGYRENLTYEFEGKRDPYRMANRLNGNNLNGKPLSKYNFPKHSGTQIKGKNKLLKNT